jgi:T5SS/PEP-CTERM-associated repeat protein
MNHANQTVQSQARRTTFVSLGLLLLFTVLLSPSVRAADISWRRPEGGNFNSAGSWFGGVVPGVGDTARFGLSATLPLTEYTVSFSANATNSALKVEDDFVLFDLNGHSYTTEGTNMEIGNVVGKIGQLTLTDGTWNLNINTSIIEIGAVAGASGALFVSTGAQIGGLMPLVHVGDDGGGTLLVQNGGDISASATRVGWTSAGAATITGASSTLINSGALTVGHLGSGVLTISSGGVVQSAGGTIAGAATGSVNVTNATSRWTNSGELKVAVGAVGELNISNIGRVENTNAYLGWGDQGTATIGDDFQSAFLSQWINSGTLSVGYFGNGTLTIKANGYVQNTNGMMADQNFSTSQVTLQSPNAQWVNSGDLIVGKGGDATLTVTAGTVESVNAMLGEGNFSSGTATIDGPDSEWINPGNLSIGGGVSGASAGPGTLTITNGGQLTAAPAPTVAIKVGDLGTGTLTVSSGGVIQGFSEFFVAFNPGVTGTATVTGAGSIVNAFGLSVGTKGTGTFDITAGGTVQTAGTGSDIGSSIGASGTVNVDGANSRWINSSNELFVGYRGSGTLTITNAGRVDNSDGWIGYREEGTGQVTVAGANSLWNNSGDLTIGRLGDGTLVVTGGGIVQNSNGYIGRSTVAGGSGTVTVTGAGSTWTNSNFVYVGYDSEGVGSLSVEAGGAVTCTTGFVGNVAGSHGTANVDGPGSTWTTSGTLAVGDGSLTVSNGGAVVTNGSFGTLAAESTWNADVTVVGQGSSWSLTGALLTVGFGGTAAVNILDGGSVASFDARLAADTGSSGTVVVGGAGSTWTIGRRLGVGGDAGTLVGGGAGTLNINPGGTVEVEQNTVIFPSSIVRLQGGTLDTTAISFPNGGGQFEWTSGTLHVGTFNGNLVNQGGTLAPGHSAGTTTIAGSYAQQSGGKLEIQIGFTPGAIGYDRVIVSSLADLNGELQLALLDGFVPGASSTFTILTTASGIVGAFSNIANGARLDTIDDLGSFQVNYGAGSAFNPNMVVLSNFIPNALPGDFNDDGVVDAADFVMWRKLNLGSAAYNTWHQNYGESLGGSISNSIPEPVTTRFLLFTAICSFVRLRPLDLA